MKVVLFWVSRIQLGKSGLGYCLVSFPAPSFSKSRATDSCNLDLARFRQIMCSIRDSCNRQRWRQYALLFLNCILSFIGITSTTDIYTRKKHWRPVRNPQKKVSFKMRETNALRTNCAVDWGLASLFVCLLHMYVCLLYLCGFCLFACFPRRRTVADVGWGLSFGFLPKSGILLTQL